MPYKPELLAPAGNLEKLKFAVMYGADAVYLAGKRFGLRAFAGNFDDDELREGVAFAHAHQVKVFVTINIFPHNEDLVGLEDYLLTLSDLKVDALICADPGSHPHRTSNRAGASYPYQHPSQQHQLG